MIVVLFSGGLDSTTLAELARDRGQLHSILYCSYGQQACSNELGVAIQYAQRHSLHLEIRQIHMSGLDDMNGTEAGPRIVPGRNLILLGMAANYAAACGASTVWYGATAADADYPDCSKAFVDSLSNVIANDTNITIEAPLIDKSKAEVLALAKGLQIDTSTIWWCYQPTDNSKACGKCNSCLAHPE